MTRQLPITRPLKRPLESHAGIRTRDQGLEPAGKILVNRGWLGGVGVLASRDSNVGQ